MKKLLIAAFFVLLAAAMALTVPNKKAHKEAMMVAVKEYVDEEADKKGIGAGFLGAIGKGIVNRSIELVLNAKLEVDNYYLFNTTHINLKGKSKVLSVGLLGHVFTFDKEMLRDALEASSREKADQKAIED